MNLRVKMLNSLIFIALGAILGFSSAGWLVTHISAKAQILEVKNCSRELLDQYNLLLAAFKIVQPDSKERALAGSQAFTDQERRRK